MPKDTPMKLACGCARYRFDEESGKRLPTGQIFALKSGRYMCKCGFKWEIRIEWVKVVD